MWALAQVMWCLITHCQPPTGPVPELVSVQPPDPDEEPDIGQASKKNIPKVTNMQPCRIQPARATKRVATATPTGAARPPSKRRAPAKANAKAKAKPAKGNDKAQDAEDVRKKWTYGNYICHDDIPVFQNVDPDLRTLVMRCMMDEPADRPGMTEIRKIIDSKLHAQWDPNDTDLKDDMDQCFNNVPPPAAHPKEVLAEVRNLSHFQCYNNSHHRATNLGVWNFSG